MKPRRRCDNCRRGKHSLCSNLVETADGEKRPCSCCGELSVEERTGREKKEKEDIAQKRYETQYQRHGDNFDWFLRRKKQTMGLGLDDSINPFLPKDDKEMIDWAKEAGIPRKWLEHFVAEYREDLDPE